MRESLFTLNGHWSGSVCLTRRAIMRRLIFYHSDVDSLYASVIADAM
ncbi:MAG: hypothetical protein J2P54_20635 [Bradyrhizobiaceae bacterium]|nr:hypothetical protein [Bradyrhizobiaceae bacterium]